MLHHNINRKSLILQGRKPVTWDKMMKERQHLTGLEVDKLLAASYTPNTFNISSP